jgi:hypothetical protein
MSFIVAIALIVVYKQQNIRRLLPTKFKNQVIMSIFSIKDVLENHQSSKPVTQNDRLIVIMCAMWFSAKHYVPEEGSILAILDIEDAATSVIAILDELNMIRKLPTG